MEKKEKKEKRKVDMQRLTFDIPEDVHRKLKIRSIESGTSMNKLLLEWILEKLKLSK